MQSLTRGWSFLQEAWQMAFRDNDLIKPSIYAMIVGFVITIIGIVPLIAAAFLFGGESSLIGQIAMVVVGAVLIFIHYVVSYIFSGMTVYLIYGYLAEGDGRMDKAWAIVRREFWHILSLAAASTVVSVFTNSLRRRSNRSRNVVAGMAGNAVGGILETVWTEASFLILPVMMIEDANLVTGIKRATYIAKNNLLLIGVSTVGVKWITGFISFVLGVIGLVIGVGLGLGIISIANSSTIGIVLWHWHWSDPFLPLCDGGECHQFVYDDRIQYLLVLVGTRCGKSAGSRTIHAGCCTCSARRSVGLSF